MSEDVISPEEQSIINSRLARLVTGPDAIANRARAIEIDSRLKSNRSVSYVDKRFLYRWLQAGGRLPEPKPVADGLSTRERYRQALGHCVR